jgi:hypothetical protein
MIRGVQVEALLCPRCGGPVERPAQVPTLIDCAYCGATIAISDAASLLREDQVDAARDALVQGGRVGFLEALRRALTSGQPPEAAIRDAATKHLGVGGQAATMARVTLGIVREVERESGIRVEKDPMVLARVAEAYLRALGELRTEPATEINMPFLAANEKGPYHFLRPVTPAILAAFAEGRVQVKEVPPQPAAEPKVEPKKKRWWQF